MEEFGSSFDSPVTRRALDSLRRECQEEVNKTREEIQRLRKELQKANIPVEATSFPSRWQGGGFGGFLR